VKFHGVTGIKFLIIAFSLLTVISPLAAMPAYIPGARLGMPLPLFRKKVT
jgi:hypothetical protein